MRELVGTRVVGMKSLISCMTRTIPYMIALFIWIWFDVLCTPLHVHFRLGVALVGEFFYWALLTRYGTHFQVQWVYRETALRRGRDYEEGRHVALMYVKRIVIKFFWTIV